MAAKKFMVRPGFWVHGLGADPLGPNSVVELSDDEAAAYATQIEPYTKKLHDERVAAEKAADAPAETQAAGDAG